tara:strand:+ start:5696 stop:5905 length:210 start_codon:yes stop_codon:yes gene_type:complete
MEMSEAMRYKFGDRVKEIEPLCSEGDTGTLVDRGTPQKNGDVRYLVRWDSYSDNVYGCRESNIKEVNDE